MSGEYGSLEAMTKERAALKTGAWRDGYLAAVIDIKNMAEDQVAVAGDSRHQHMQSKAPGAKLTAMLHGVKRQVALIYVRQCELLESVMRETKLDIREMNRDSDKRLGRETDGD